MLKYILTGYSLSVKLLSGNPSTDTDEFCSSRAAPQPMWPDRRRR